MGYQLSFFDLPGVINYPDWHNMTIEQISMLIGEQLGIRFSPDTRFNGEFNEFIAYKSKKEFYTIGIDHSETCDERSGQAFIGVDYDNGIKHLGCSKPCDSIEEAIEFFRNIENRYDKANEEKPETDINAESDLEEDEDIDI